MEGGIFNQDNATYDDQLEDLFYLNRFDPSIEQFAIRDEGDLHVQGEGKSAYNYHGYNENGLQPAVQIDGPHMYKGHPQPAVDERLFASKNFLADEDPNRCLDFDSRIDQIEGYVAHIENVALPCDPGLFRDVKVMLEVHRDWEARTRDRPPDTSCCYAPAILPFSTRLISAETGTNLEVGWEATGIATQMRHNHAPFTIQRDINSAEFWRELHKDSSTHPSLVPERNLLWEERRAYGWALADPAIISYWMHPTKGIMKTGVRMIDPLQWYQKPREQTVVRNRPARGWIPSYALERGDKINRLLGKKDTTPEEWQELKALLCDFEPENIHQLHLDLVGYHDALEIIGLSEEQKATMEQTETQFKDEYHDWIETFKNDGVFFIVATATQRPIDQPGVFYIVDGILAQAHRNILNAAQTLLEKMFSIGRENMEIEETDSLDSLLSHTLPTHIKHLENKNANILRNAGVSSWRELSEDAQATSNTLYHKTQLLRREWENQLKSLSAEFRYLRPSELVRDDPKLLYLPWDLLTVPVVEHRIVPERSLPQSADRLQSDINASLQVHPVDETELDLNSELDISNSESGAPSLVEMLFQVAYPELRRLLIPYISLLRLPITGFEKSVLELIKEETKRLYCLWLLGLGDKITIKLPRPEQQPEHPGVLYCNLPYQDSDKGQQAAYDHIAERINQLLTKKESKGYWNKMEALFKDLQYPELRGIFDNMQKQRKTPGGAKLREVWNTMFRRWIRSLRGTRVRVQRSRTSFDPDEDPSVVYYCDQFLDEQDPPISTSTRDTISGYWDPEDHEAAELEDFVEKFEDLLPEKVLNALKHWERSRTDHDKGLFRWRFLCWFNNSRRPSTFVYKRQGTSSTPVLGDIDGEFTKVLSTKNGYSNWQSGNEGDDVTSQQVYEVGVQMLRPRKPEEMESAINHVLKKLKNLCFEEPYLDSQPERWLSIWERICQLMTPFFPDTVWDLYKQIETLNGELEDNAKDDRRTLGSQVMELHSLSSYYCEELRVWMFELLGDLPVRIAKPGERIKPSLLYFQPESQKFDIRYPMVVPQNIYHASTWNYDELIYTASSDKTTPLASRAATPRIMEAAHREQCIHDLEGLINAQLEIRGKRTLDWRESEKLRSYLRLVMPSELFALDEELRGLDAKARSPNEILSPDERLNFWTLWDLWKREYKKWIDEFPDGITIHNGSGASHDPKVLELMQEPPWNLEEFILPENSALPTPVKENEELLEHYLSTPNSLETDQARDMDYLLRSLWRCTGVQFRRIFRHRLEQYIFGEDMSNSPPDEEENVLIEAALAHACGMFVTKLKKTPGSRVRIREDVPGNYHLCEDTPTPLDHTNKEAQVQWSESNVKVQLNPAHLQPKEEFFALARLIRHTETSKLDEEELSRILPHLALTAPVEIMAIDDIIIQLLVKEQTSGLSCIESEALMLADYQQLWLRWGQMFPELRVRVISYSSITNAVRQPGTRLVPGSKCQDTCSTTRLPNPFEVRELEIEINNLMTREISGTISHEQQRELEFILPVLLPHHLRLLNSRIKALESDFVNQPSIGISHIMELNEVLRQRFDSLSAWKRDFLSEGGIFLNPHLYNKSQVIQACSQAKEWRDSARRRNGTVDWPATDTDFEDSTVKDLHHMCDTLIEYLESGACGNIGKEEKLLFRFMCPLSMTSILDQIKTQQYDLGTGVGDPRNDMTLQFRKQIFITRYMGWLQSLSQEQLKTYRAEINADYQGKIDFSAKAERRGIQRAAIEIALNLFATNQEQKRPSDPFRILDLPSQYQLPKREIPLSLSLEPWNTPLEQDTFEFSKRLSSFRQQKDSDYGISGTHLAKETAGLLQAPLNYNGPFALPTGADLKEAARARLVHLAQIAEAMGIANSKAPRPLMQRLLLRTIEGSNPAVDIRNHRFYDDEPLTKANLELLLELAAPSWNDERREYNEYMIPGIVDQWDDTSRLEEFERDVNDVQGLPVWISSIPGEPDDRLYSDHPYRFTQTPHYENLPTETKVTTYGIETQGMELTKLRQIINDNRLRRLGNGRHPHLWTEAETLRYLQAMRSAGRIHLDYDIPHYLDQFVVSRIPSTGHPENKYVLSRDSAEHSPGISTRESNGKYKLEVQYDALGRKGPPIIQPNKFHYLQKLAFMLGRDMLYCTRLMAEKVDRSPHYCLGKQWATLVQAEDMMKFIKSYDEFQQRPSVDTIAQSTATLQNMAQDLHRTAPDLARDAGFNFGGNIKTITEAEAAALLQMQIIEEASNNWESRFPENEHVWDFAGPRLDFEVVPRLTEFFNMRRFPVCCQSSATQTAINQSGPIIQKKALPVVQTTSVANRRRSKKTRHLKGPKPYFPFGETPYQQAYLSFRMEQDLKDVPELQQPSSHRSFFSRKRNSGGHIINQYALPKIPSNWQPDNISEDAKRAQMIEIVKADPGFPDALEYYHTQGEIEQIQRRQAFDIMSRKIQRANDAIEKHTGRNVNQLTNQELNAARTKLRIDQFTGMFILGPEKVTASRKISDLGFPKTPTTADPTAHHRVGTTPSAIKTPQSLGDLGISHITSSRSLAKHRAAKSRVQEPDENTQGLFSKLMETLTGSGKKKAPEPENSRSTLPFDFERLPDTPVRTKSNPTKNIAAASTESPKKKSTGLLPAKRPTRSPTKKINGPPVATMPAPIKKVAVTTTKASAPKRSVSSAEQPVEVRRARRPTRSPTKKIDNPPIQSPPSLLQGRTETFPITKLGDIPTVESSKLLPTKKKRLSRNTLPGQSSLKKSKRETPGGRKEK